MKHPIWEILREQGRSLKWLARKINYNHGYVRAISGGSFGASAEFRRRCVLALDVPESVLFVGPVGIVRPRQQREVA